MSNQHVLKIHPAPLADLISGAKTAEVRRNDRGFQVGDTVRLMEVNPETGNWTGAADHVRTISHVQTGYGLPDGLCVLSYAQAEHQAAQGAQAGDERAAFEAWHRSRFATKGQTGDPTRDMHNGVKAEKYGPEEQQIRWECWQARAARDTQPAAGEPVYQLRNPKIGSEWHEVDRVAYDEFSVMPAYERRTLWTAPPAAAHGDEAVRALKADLDAAQEFCRINSRSGMQYAEQRDQARDQLESAKALFRLVVDWFGPTGLPHGLREIDEFLSMRAQAGEGGVV